MDLFDREKAATELFRRARNLALTYLTKYPNTLDRDEATSLAGYAIALALNIYRPERGPIEPLVDAIVRRQVMGEVRRSLRRQKVVHPMVTVGARTDEDFEDLKAGRGAATVEPISPENVEDYFVTLERHAAIVRGVKKVNPEDLTLIRARRAGNTYRAIGKAIGIRGQSVHERVAKARATITAELEAVG